jgi:predicted membrane chloride channel (bestrophin family)
MFSFLTDLFHFKGTALIASIPQLITTSAFSYLAKWAHNTYHYTTDPVILRIVGGMLAFFIVFRTNLAYDRYYEGRRLLISLNKGLCDVMTCIVSSAPSARGRCAFDVLSCCPVATFHYRIDAMDICRKLNILFAVIRQDIRESRTSPQDGVCMSLGDYCRQLWDHDGHCPKARGSTKGLNFTMDLYGNPRVGDLLTSDETLQYSKVRPTCLGQRCIDLNPAPHLPSPP